MHGKSVHSKVSIDNNNNDNEYTVSPAGLEVPPLGHKWGKCAKKLGYASSQLQLTVETADSWIRNAPKFFRILTPLTP